MTREPDPAQTRPPRAKYTLLGIAVRATVALLYLVAAAMAVWFMVPLPGAPPGFRYRPRTRKLMVWHAQRGTSLELGVARMARRLERQHRDVQVTVVAVEPAAYPFKLRTAMAADALPDVFEAQGGTLLAARGHAGRLLDLTVELRHREWQRNFLGPSLALCEFKGTRYGVPIAVDGLFLWANAKLLAQHKLQPPRTITEMRDVSGRLAAAGITPVAMGNADRAAAGHWLACLSARLAGKDLFAGACERRAGYKFTDAAFVHAGHSLRQIAAGQCFSPGSEERTCWDAMADFCEERAAMILSRATPLARALRGRRDVAKHVQCLPFPRIEGGSGEATSVVARAEIVFAVSRNCGEAGYAFRLLRMLTSSDIGAALMQDGRLSAVSLPETASVDCLIMNQAAQVFAQATGVQTDYGDYLSPQMHQRHRDMAHRVMWGEVSPVEGAQQMEALASDIAKREP